MEKIQNTIGLTRKLRLSFSLRNKYMSYNERIIFKEDKMMASIIGASLHFIVSVDKFVELRKEYKQIKYEERMRIRVML